MIDYVTPMILTFNEEANITRTLDALSWAKQILIVDSYSTDRTLEIASRYSQVQVVQRQFDDHASQCNFGLERIETPWVLSLDADYIVDSNLVCEMPSLDLSFSGFMAKFRYAIDGRVLRASLYPPRVVLYKRDAANYILDGHTQRVVIEGKIGQLKSIILHDDRKPLSTWFRSQSLYASREAEKLSALPSKEMGWKDRLRKRIVPVPILTFFYCLFVKGLILDGWAGWFYTFQRVFAEISLGLLLIQNKLHEDRA